MFSFFKKKPAPATPAPIAAAAPAIPVAAPDAMASAPAPRASWLAKLKNGLLTKLVDAHNATARVKLVPLGAEG